MAHPARIAHRRALESASTLLGVSQPGYPGQLVEIDVTAALSGSGPA
jgi:hypothetical protein